MPCPVEAIPAFVGLVVATLGSAAVCLVIGAGQFIDLHIFDGVVDELLLLLLLLLKVWLEHLVELITFLLCECLNEVPQFLMGYTSLAAPFTVWKGALVTTDFLRALAASKRHLCIPDVQPVGAFNFWGKNCLAFLLILRMSFIGKVYRIDFPDGYFYIGSTRYKLKERLNKHKQERMKFLKADLAAGRTLTSRFEIYLSKNGWNNPEINLIEEVKVENSKELKDHEMEHISKHYHDSKNLNAICKGISRYYTPEQKIKRIEELCKKQLQSWELWIERQISELLSAF
jgi:hypothetical protein